MSVEPPEPAEAPLLKRSPGSRRGNVVLRGVSAATRLVLKDFARTPTSIEQQVLDGTNKEEGGGGEAGTAGALVDPLVGLAKAAVLRGHYITAAQVFTHVLEKNPTNVKALVARSMCNRCVAKWGAALEDANAALELNPGYRGAYLRKVEALIGVCRYDDAEQVLQEAARKFTRHPEVLKAQWSLQREQAGATEEERGHNAIDHGEYSYAVGHYTAALKASPAQRYTAALYSNRALAYIKLEDFKSAFADANKAVRLAPEWAVGHARQGCALFGLSQYVDSAASYAIAQKLDPKTRELVFEVSRAKAKGHRLTDVSKRAAEAFGVRAFHRAAHLFSEAIDISAYDPQLYKARSLCYYKIGDFDAAYFDGMAMLRLQPDSVSAYIRVASALEQRGNLEEAGMVLKKGIERCRGDLGLVAAADEIRRKQNFIATGKHDEAPSTGDS